MLGLIAIIGIIAFVFAKNRKSRIIGLILAIVWALASVVLAGEHALIQLIAQVMWFAFWLPILYLIRWLIRRRKSKGD